MIDIEKLKALALAATLGPWRITKYCSVMDEGMETFIVSADSSHEDRSFIAAANPSAVLELIAEVERLTCELQNQREIAQHWKASAGYISAPAAGTVEKDAARLDFLIGNSAFITWATHNDTFKRCQLWNQDDDENYIVLSGDEKSFATPREAIDAAIEAHNKAGKEQG